MTFSTLDPGATFAERYRIVRLVKAGGMGEVHEAVHVVTGRRCAIKVMLRGELRREDLRDRFLQEARVASKVRSDHIVDVFDAGLDAESGLPFLVMELLDGEDLGERVGRDGPLDAAEAVGCLAHVALALGATHRRGIVHRDIKPSNVFLTRRNDGMPMAKVLDFGVAKLIPLDASAEAATSDVGTPLYMAPEQFRTEARVGLASDIYSLGMLAYTVLVGAHYWQEEKGRSPSPFAFTGVAAEGPREAASKRAARRGVVLPAAFDSWFARCTAYQPADRFPSAIEAVRELAVALDVPVPLMRLADESDEALRTPAPSAPRASEAIETLEETEGSRRGDTTVDTDGSARPFVLAPRRLESVPPSAPSAADTSTSGSTDPAVSQSGAHVAVARAPRERPRRRFLAAAAGVLVSTAAALVAASLGRVREPRTSVPAASSPSAESALSPTRSSPSAPPMGGPGGTATPRPAADTVSLEDLPVENGVSSRSSRAAPAAEARGAQPERGPVPDVPLREELEPPPAPLSKDQRRGLYSRH